jgi:hypothetical protein
MKIKKMANKKRTKFEDAIKAISEDQIGKDDLLSHDLATRVGSLNKKVKKVLKK